MNRIVSFVYGIACHLLFLATYVYMALFVGDLLAPKTIDTPASASAWQGLALDALLIGLFAAPHSIMARPAFKRWWTRIVPTQIERATYVLTSCALMILLMWQWRPVGAVVWSFEDPTARAIAYGLFAAGWLMVPLVSLLINHFDLFGSRQVWLHLKRRRYTHLPFRTPGICRQIRHPLYVGWMIAFWATPTMTAGHLLFAALMTGYMLAAIPYEERDLVAQLGDDYRDYRERVPALIPRVGGADPGQPAASEGAA